VQVQEGRDEVKRWRVILRLNDGTEIRSNVTFVTRREATRYGRGVCKLVPKVETYRAVRAGRRRAA